MKKSWWVISLLLALVCLGGCAIYKVDYSDGSGKHFAASVQTLQTADSELVLEGNPLAGDVTTLYFRKIGSAQNEILSKALDKIPVPAQ
jgi:hypothetical protein